MATYGFDENKNLTEISSGSGGDGLCFFNGPTRYFSSISRETSSFNNGTLITYNATVADSPNETLNLTQLVSDLKNNKTYLVTVSILNEGTGTTPAGVLIPSDDFVAVSGLFYVIYSFTIVYLVIDTTVGEVRALTLDSGVNVVDTITLQIYQE